MNTTAEPAAAPDATPFECFQIACFRRGRELTEVLDRRMDLHEAFGEWNPEAIAGADDDALSSLEDRGGIFADSARPTLVRDVAKACVEGCPHRRDCWIA